MRAFALLCLAGCASAARLQGSVSLRQDTFLGLNAQDVLANPGPAFLTFARSQNKAYLQDEAEMGRRLAIFTANAERVASGGATHETALNEWADLTWAEFSQSHLGYDSSLRQPARLAGQAFSHENVTAPSHVDWVKDGAVTAVKNQLFCGSCWAFATTGAVEGVNYLYSGELVSLSEQELVDCDTAVDQGCGGGLMDNAYEFIIKNGGLDTEADYTYDSVGGVCNALRESRTIVSIDGYEDVPVNDEGALRKAVAAQPVSVAICAPETLQFYSGGIVGGESCTALNHGVLAVGYGTSKDGTRFWKIKNSWGASWGEAGYFRLLADAPAKEGQLGLCMAASYPTKSNPNPKRQPEVCGYFGWSSCPYTQQCSCKFGILDLFCLSWGCEDIPVA